MVHALEAAGAEVVVGLNDKVDLSEIEQTRPTGLILSPGPGRPEHAGFMPRILTEAVGRFPILGVCLGLQMIAVHFGGALIEARQIVHGKASRVTHDNEGVFHGAPNPLRAGRYHSLAVDPENFPSELIVTARTDDDEIMGLRHRELPIEAVQFHPESILTPEGDRLIRNFMESAARYRLESAH